MTTKNKTKICMVLLALLVLIGALQPVTTYAVTGGLGVFLYWPGDLSSDGGFPQNTYTDIQVYSEEYPDAGPINMVTNIQPEIFYIVTVPGLDAATASREDYDLTLTLKEKNNDAPELKLSKNNYYLPVRVTWTANDGRQCDIFIIAIPEIRDYSRADFSKPAQMYLDLLLGNELDDFYNSLAATKKGVAGGYYIDNYRCLMRILNSTNWLRAGFLDSYKDYYSKSEDALAEVQQTLNQDGWFSPEQATAWFTDVLGYYWEYCEARIEEPELLSLQVMGVDAVKVSDSEYSLCLPEGVNWKKASSSIKYRANTINVFEAKGNWTPGAGIMLLLSARDPATNTVYNSGTNGYVQGSYYLRLSTGDPVYSVHSFQINDRTASIDEKNLTISLHFAKNWSWKQIPQITCSGTDYEFLDADGNTVEPDEGGQIDFSRAKKLRLIEDLMSYAQAGKDTEGLSYHKDYELKFTQGNSAECELLSYSVGATGEQIDWSADGKTITVTIPYATDWNTLKSNYTISYDATIAMPNGEDFEHSETTPIQYTVTAENGKDQRTYSVIVKKIPPATGNEIESFYCGSLEGTIDHDAKTITLELPEGSTKRFAPQITIPEFAVVEPASGVLQDFTEPVFYTVTAQNGDTRTYKVIVTVSTQRRENPDKMTYQAKLEEIIGSYQKSAEDDWEWMQLGIYDNLPQDNGPNTNNGFDIAKEIKDLNVGPKGRMTDIARLTMLLTSRGYDCSNLAKYNDGKPFLDGSSNEIDNLVANIASTTDGGVNGRIFALCALDMGNYTLPANGARSRESLLEDLLNHKYGSDNFGVDMVGMLMYAIAPYQDDPTYGERTKAKLDEGIEAILKEMREDYTFHSWGTVNSESVAQIICALASCGIDPYTDPRFGDGDRTILTQWMDMFSVPGGFKHVQSETASNLMATYQSCYALQWYLGFLEKGGAGYPYYLYYHRYDFSTVLSSEADILEFSIEGQKGVFGEENGQNTISVTLPKGMPLQNITPDFTLSEGATLAAPTLPVTFVENVAQPFTVLAEDGLTTKTYEVTVTFGDVDPAGAKLDTSTIVLQDANQRNLDILDKAVTVKEDGEDILLTVSSGIDVTKLRVIANISYRASASPVLDGSVNLDLSDWTEFAITSADGKNHATYRIKVQAKTVASITAFSLTINGKVYDGVIDNVSGTISVTGVDDSNLTTTKFAPDITLGAGTTVCSPLSGTEQDFSAPVTYTVAGRDVESRTYTVRVTNTAGSLISASGETPTPSSSARIEKFTVLGVDGEIDHTAGTIEVVLPNGTDVTAVAPVVTVPAGAVVSPVSGEVVNLSTPLTYTVRLGSETRYYVVRVVYQRSTSQQLWDKVSENNTVTDHQESRSTHRFS